MNNERRKRIREVADRLDELSIEDFVVKITGSLDLLKAAVETIRDEEQEFLDKIPENAQGSESADLAEEAAGFLYEAGDQIHGLVSSLGEVEDQFLQAVDLLNQAQG